MKEDFIHFLWKFRLFSSKELTSTLGLPIEIVNSGFENKNSGPDFTTARIKIDGTLWVGNVEIHVKSSDWFKHGHQNDPAYENVILHVVMEHDKEITDKTGKEIPVFEVRKFFDMALYYQYEKIIESKTWIPCENFINQSDDFIVKNWLSRLLVERLENKSDEIRQFYQYFDQNWEQTFYYFLARNFGFKTNASPFALLAQKTPYKILAKHRDDLTQLEALLFGQAGFLEGTYNEAYPALLKREFEFLKHKYSLQPIDVSLWKFSKLRPSNFPTIRIAQFARLCYQAGNLFDPINKELSISEMTKLFTTQCSPYWNNHYRFGKESVVKEKHIGNDAVENIIINTIVPLKFVYGTESLKQNIKDHAVNLLIDLPAEKNSLITRWIQTGIKPENSAESQALLQLKKYYCTPKKCLQCAIGHQLVRNF